MPDPVKPAAPAPEPEGDEVSIRRTPHTFYVFLSAKNMSSPENGELLNLVQLSPGFPDTSKAKSWLRKNFSDLLQKYGSAAVYTIAAVQPPIVVKTETKVKLGI
jgi:hypothetical protein